MIRSRSWAACLCVTALGALVPVVVVAPSAHADLTCQKETRAGIPPFQTGCDDETPPETALTAVSPAPTKAGYVSSSAIRFDFSGSPGGAGETDPVAFECQFYNTAIAPTTWNACSSPQVFSGLAQSGAVAYTFKVRAMDASDSGIQACDGSPGIDNCLGDPDVEDKDATPAVTAFKVDTTAPNTFITRTPHDDIRPDWPVSLTRSPQLVLNTNEGGAAFQCEVNRKGRLCAEGPVTLKRLRSGTQTFSAQAVDAAGNADPIPATTKFFVPANLRATSGSGWTRVRRGEAFDGDVVTASKVGSVLRIGHQRNVREVRLIAPAGPRLGRIQVRVGHSRWYTVNLNGKAARQQTYLVRDQFAPRQTGAITIRVLSVPRGGSVQLDALVARG